jgi:glutathione S-transferase
MPFTSDYPLTSLVALSTLVEYQAFGAKVGQVRKKEKFEAPKIVGNEEFEKAYRVQMNTLESLPTQLTCLAMFAELSKNDKLTAGIGSAFIIGRLLFALGYYKNPKKRSLGFGISFLSQLALIGGSAYYLVKKFL